MTQPECGCFAHMDMDKFDGASCEHGVTGDHSDPTKVIVAMPFIVMSADSES